MLQQQPIGFQVTGKCTTMCLRQKTLGKATCTLYMYACTVSYLLLFIYLFFYPFIDALIREALRNFVVYSMYNDNKGFLFYSVLFYIAEHTGDKNTYTSSYVSLY